jgi:cystathionine gamma-synthase
MLAESRAATPLPVGTPIPETLHAVSVSLPTWSSNIGYEEGDPEVTNAMKGGYPRFVFHPLVKELIAFCIERFATMKESCLVFNSRLACSECRQFMHKFNETAQIRIVELSVTPHVSSIVEKSDMTLQDNHSHSIIYSLLFPVGMAPIAKHFWQHTGQGVSSRYAEHCLRMLEVVPGFTRNILPNSGRSRYHKSDSAVNVNNVQRAVVEKECQVFVEERFGRNLDIKHTEHAVRILKRRICGALGDATKGEMMMDVKLDDDPKESDVYLFPGGMSAIYEAHKLAMAVRPEMKSVQFGYLSFIPDFLILTP